MGTLLEVAEDHSTHSAAGRGEEGSAVVATGLAILHPGNKTLISFLIIDFYHCFWIVYVSLIFDRLFRSLTFDHTFHFSSEAA